MVSKPVGKSAAINNKKVGDLLFLVLLALFVAATVLIAGLFVKGLGQEKVEEPTIDGGATDDDVVENEAGASESSEITVVKPKRIDFQTLIDDWANSTGGNRSVLIYDLDREEIVGSYNVEENYGTASLYKLFVVYEGYRRIENKTWDKNAKVGYTGKTILECLDLAIRESNSDCAEALWAMIGHAELDQIIKNDFRIDNSDTSHLVSNVGDIMKIMQLFYEHPDFNDEVLVARMKDSFLNQPVTTYNWRQGLPSGFTKANVFNKVGWDYNPTGKYWSIYHDAAIVEFPEQNRHFIVVVMTNKVPYEKIRELGTMIEASV